MAYIDKLKEEIGVLKIIFSIFLLTNISLIGWIGQNHIKANPILVISAMIAAVGLMIANIWLLVVIYDKIDELEEL